MKKFKLILITVTLIFTACFMTGCGKNVEVKDEATEEKSVTGVLVQQFKEEIKKEHDIEKIASSIAKNKILAIEVNVSPIGKEDYISGFHTEIKGFNKAVAIRPFIGSIPFVAYIFEVEDAESFAEKLQENADLRWNICTEADDMKVATFDQYVFFVMAPESFEEE